MTENLPAGGFVRNASTVFLLSPARCDGRRAKMVLNERASFELATNMRARGAPIGEVFAFLSGLYFRGKLTYATAFGRRVDSGQASFVITTDRGLVSPNLNITRDDLLRFGDVDLASRDERFRAPLRSTAEHLDAELAGAGNIVLLGSIATGKYVDTLEFVGRGDMSRGGLLLRSARDRSELTYVPVRGAIRRGKRPPKLEPLKRIRDLE